MNPRVTLLVGVALVIASLTTWQLIESRRVMAAVAAEQAYATEKTLAAAQVKAAPHGAVVHTVIFYLKKDATGQQDAMIADCHKLLESIPSVKHLWVGKPTEKGTPNVAVTDYHLGLTIQFADADGLHQYLDHPQHKEFVAKHGPHIEKVLVYDFTHEPAK